MGFDLYALPSTSESLNSSHPNDQPISGSGLSKAALRLDTLPRDTSAYCVSVSRHLCVHGRAYVSCIFILLHAHIYICVCVRIYLFLCSFIYLSLSLSITIPFCICGHLFIHVFITIIIISIYSYYILLLLLLLLLLLIDTRLYKYSI
jgi:hypothetical protein